MSKTVVIVQRRLTNYRVPLFDRLKRKLAKDNIELKLLVGVPKATEVKRRDGAEIPWATPVPTRYFLNGRACWQSYSQHLNAADLVIITQENSLLANHLLIARRQPFKVAFWGHGANLQSRAPNGVFERYKRWTTRRVDWWFAYTELSARLIREAGFASSRITVLNNVVDMSALVLARDSIAASDMEDLRTSLGLQHKFVALYVGALDTVKRLDFLFEAADRVRATQPSFHMLIIGDGPLRDLVRHWCAARPWVHWLGYQQGPGKARYASVANVMVAPGAVGLGILDSFAFGLPLFTTDCGTHGPEIAYLKNGENGWMTTNNLTAYADAINQIMNNTVRLDAMRAECFKSAAHINLDNMVDHFAGGIGQALAL